LCGHNTEPTSSFHALQNDMGQLERFLDDLLPRTTKEDTFDDWILPPQQVVGEELNNISSKLITLRGKVGSNNRQAKVRFLVDSGASRNFISRKSARRLHPDTRRRLNPLTVKLPDGRILTSTEGVECPYRIGTLHASLQARVLDLKDYDVILGLEWLRQWDPDVRWRDAELAVTDNRTTHPRRHYLRSGLSTATLQNPKIDSPTFEIASLSAIRRALRKGQKNEAPATLWMVREPKLTPPTATTGATGIRKRKGRVLRRRSLSTEPDANLPAQVVTTDKSIRNVIQRFQHRFRDSLPHKLPRPREWDHKIDTGDSKPINTAPYRLSHQHQEELQHQVEDLLARGLIRPSSSEWGCPVIFVPKPGGKWRMCMDYRALNDKTRKNTYPLPRIDECIDSFAQARTFTKLDLLSGYWQLRISDVDVPKTAFNTRQGKFEFLVMPFGLTNAPATFQTMMNSILHPYLFKFVVVYLDDIVIYSQTPQEHAEHLKLVFEALEKHDLYAHPEKCVIGTDNITFCGHRITQGHTEPLRDKVQVIKDWPQPETVHEVRQFLGLTGFYRRYVKGYAHITAPLTDLLKELDPAKRQQKHRAVSWTYRCQRAFNELKRRLTSKPVLAHPDFGKPFIIETDASEEAIGISLHQTNAKNEKHPVAYDGRKLSAAERRYPVHEKELLAIKEALRVWRHYIAGKKTLVLTDHQSLRYMNSIRNPSGRMARWIDEFQEYDLDIQYRKGSEAVVPDALSRRPDFMSRKSEEEVLTALAAEGIREDQARKMAPELLTAANDAQARESREEEWLRGLRELLEGKESTVSTAVRRRLRPSVVERFWISTEGEIRRKHYSFRNDDQRLTTARKWEASAPFVPIDCRRDFVRKMHETYGHLRWSGLKGIVETHGWWPGMETDINEFAKFCPACQVSQRSGEKEEETRFHQVRKVQPFEAWGIDIVGELPKTLRGNRFIICAVDYATNWPVTMAVSSAPADVVADFIYEKIYLQYGPPRTITTDNGPQFTSDMLAHLIQTLKTRHHLSSPYHPRANGKVERYNGLLGEILTKMTVDDYVNNWDSYLPAATYATRVRAHRTTGLTPFELVYGRKPLDYELAWSQQDRFAPEIDESTNPDRDDHLERIKAVRTARQVHYQRLLNRAARDGLISTERVASGDLKPKFQTGSHVLLRNLNHRKLRAKWIGPFEVIKAHPLGTYALRDMGGKVLRNLVHGNRLTAALIPTDHVTKKSWVSYFKHHISDGYEDARQEDVDQLLDDGQRAIKDIKSMTMEQWQNLQQRWDSEHVEVERHGPRQFQKGAEAMEVDLSREAREIIQREARRDGTETRDVFANREMHTARLREPVAKDITPEHRDSEPLEKGGNHETVQDVEMPQRVGGGEPPLENPQPVGVGEDKAPEPTPPGDDTGWEPEGPEDRGGPEDPEEPDETRSAGREGVANPEGAWETPTADPVVEDDVETESEGPASPVRTPALQDGDDEPGQYRIRPRNGGEETTSTQDPVIGRTTDPSSIAEQEPSTMDSQVVVTPHQASKNPRKRRREAAESRQAQEGHARKALRRGGDVNTGRRAAEANPNAGEPAGERVDERERTETQYSLRRRRVLTPKASARR